MDVIPAGLDIALNHGLRVFPCRPGEKTPLVKWKDVASADLAQIAEWTREHPHSNWGAPLSDQTFALDIDQKNGVDGAAALMARIEIHGDLPHHLVNKTPNNGSHHFFTGPCTYS